MHNSTSKSNDSSQLSCALPESELRKMLDNVAALNNSKSSFMTLKYPSDRDEIDQRIEYMSDSNAP